MTILTAHRSDDVVPSAIQWYECDAEGAACSAIGGETGLTFDASAITTTTIRVEADGKTSNAWNADAATGAYIYNGFEGDIEAAVETAPFYTQYDFPYNNSFEADHFVAVDGSGGGYGLSSGGQGLGLKLLSNDAYPGTNVLGPQTFCGVRPAVARAQQGLTTWYGIKFKIPSTGYVLNHGSAQWMIEWHEQTSAGLSIAFGLTSWYYSSGTTPDMNKIQLYFRPGGGLSASPTYENWVTPLPTPVAGATGLFNASGGLKLDYWYQLVIRIDWSTSAGEFEIYLNDLELPMRRWLASSNGDGPVWSNPHSFPTLYNVGGTPDSCNYGLYMYSRRPPVSSVLHYDDFVIGPTMASVGG